MKQVFTTGQVAKICRVATRTATKWIDSGRLKGYRIPGCQDRRVPRENLIRFLRAHKMPLGELEEEELYKLLLVATDGPFRGQMTAHLPAAAGFRFEAAADGYETGSLVQSFHPDAIMIDFALGRAESLRIATRLRKNDSYRTVLVVGLAGEDEASPAKLIEYGFNEVFKKPFDVALLAERIRRLADAKRRA